MERIFLVLDVNFALNISKLHFFCSVLNPFTFQIVTTMTLNVKYLYLHTSDSNWMRALFLMLMISANCFPWGCIVQRILRVHFHQCFLDSPEVPKPYPILALDEILYPLTEVSRCSYIAWTRPSISKYAATSTTSSKSSSSTPRKVCPPVLGLCRVSETPFVSIDRIVCM